ncbi:MAG: VCBS repeat-containing protein [Deltaproteobacteria bacterium]|nr:VCBS repeat-containing protein [Deltaproteobacteria bacterium]
MRRPWEMRWLGLVLGLAASCRPELTVPIDANIVCRGERDCPEGWLCRGERCVIPEDTPPAVLLEPAGRMPVSPAVLSLRLIEDDQQPTDLWVEYLAGDWLPATLSAVRDASGVAIGTVVGQRATSLPASATGATYTLEWDFAADGIVGPTEVQLRVTPENSRQGDPQATDVFLAGNDPPTAAFDTPANQGTSGNIVLSFMIADSSADLTTIEDGAPGGASIELSKDNGSSWSAATIILGQLTDIPTLAAPGVPHGVVWRSDADLPGESALVSVRVTARDAELAAPAVSAPFAVENSDRPVLVWIRTLDDDGDGTLDWLALGFSRPVSDGSYSYVAVDPSTTDVTLSPSVSPTPPRSVTDVADDSTVYLQVLSDHGTAFTGRFNAAGGLFASVASAAPSAPGRNVDIGDGAPPAVTGSVTVDSDGDGLLDAVVVSFSEPLDVGSVGAAGFSIEGAFIGSATLQGSAVSVNLGSPLLLTSGATPRLRYDHTLGQLADRPAAGGANRVPAFESTPKDGAGPVIIRAEYDAGLLPATSDDTLTLTLSEPVDDRSIVGAGAALHLLLSTGSFGAAATLATAGSADDAELQVVMGAGAVAPVLAGGTVELLPAGLVDAHNTAVGLNVPAAFVDSGPPRLWSIATRDLDQDGKVDHVALTWSQGIRDTSFNANALTLGAFVIAPGVAATPAGDVVDDNVVYVALVESAAADTGVTGTAHGSTGLVQAHADGDNSEAFAGVAVVDEAPPIPFSALTADLDVGGSGGGQNGKIERLVVSFSENVGGATSVAAWRVDGVTPLDAVFSPPRQVTLVFAEAGAPSTGALPALSYVGAGCQSPGGPATPLHDFVDLCPPALAYATTDGAAPRIVTATLRDTEPDGNIDAVDLVFSEPVRDTTFLPPGFSLAGVPTAGFVTQTSIDDAQGRVTSAAAAQIPGTAGAGIELTYDAAVGRVADLAGIRLDAVDAAGVAEVDGAGPVPVGVAVYRDLDQNRVDAGDVIDVAFGEPLLLTSPAAAAFGLSGLAGLSLGAGAAVGPGPRSNVVRITLGTGAELKQVRFAPGAEGTPTTLNLQSVSAAITDATGTEAVPLPQGLDLTAGLVESAVYGAANSAGVALADLGRFTAPVAKIDGMPEMILATGVETQIFANDGAGGFGAAPALSLASGDSRAAAAGDIDLDGDLDLLVATANGVARFVNNGNATFSAPTFLGAADARSLAVGDVNRDGKLDIVVAVGGAGNDQVWLNDGSGGFPAVTTLADGSDGRAVALGDIDKDGDLDAVVAVGGAGDDEIWRNDGSGGFSGPTYLADPLGATDGRALLLADLDRDGDLDIVVANGGADRSSLWRNDHTGNFPAPPEPLVGADCRGVAAFDDDLDGDLDLAFAVAGGPIQVWNNEGRFVDRQERAGNDARALAASDLDRDGDVDLVAAQVNGGRVLKGSMANALGPLVLSSGPLFTNPPMLTAGRSYAVGDVDGDGDADLVVATEGGGVRNVVLLWDGTTFIPGGDVGLAASSSVALADLDRDGDLDVAIGDTGAGATADQVWLNQGGAQGGVPGIFSATAANLGASVTWAFAVGDVQHDGDLDLLLAHNGAVEKEEIWLNDGAASFGGSSGFTLGTTTTTRGAAFADMDGDGDLDVVLANDLGVASEIWLFDAVGFGSGGAPSFTFSSTSSKCLTIGDWDRDGAPDVFLGKSSGFELWRNRGDGSGNVEGVPWQTVGGEGTAYAAAAADLDLDGDLDIVAAATGLGVDWGTVWIYDSQATPKLSKDGSFPPLSNGSAAMATIDIDRDGDLDILIDDGVDGIRLVLNRTR